MVRGSPARMLDGEEHMIDGTTVRDLMTTELVTLDADEHLQIAGDLMSLARVRHMPVVSGKRLVGILSQRDLFRAAVSSALHFRPAAEREWLGKIRVAEAMTTDVVTADPDWTVQRALSLMLERRIGCLPVVRDGRLVGLLSETDCLQLLRRLLDGATQDGATP
jgi:CBS domain-containing protein